jgi:periplasmic protein TonB
MFEQTFVDGVGQTKKSWTVLVAGLIQVGLVAVAVVLPMIYFDVLPNATLKNFLVAPPPPPPPPPPPAAAPQVKAPKVIPRQFDAGKLMAPKVVPKQIAKIDEEELPPPSAGGVGVVGGVPGGMAGGAVGGVLAGVLGSVPTATVALPPPPKKEEKKEVTPQRIRVGGVVQSANLIRKTQPVYPPLAKQARISGKVVLNAVISKDGTIQNLTVASGHPLLVNAAVEAVRTWVYRPTMLNGEAVEVSTTIDVNFTLSN